MANNESILISGYKITGSPSEIINQLYGVTPEIKEILEGMHVKVQKKKNSALKELNDLIKKYPSIPQFKNLLSTLYEKQGNHFMAAEINRRLDSLHPDYLYGKINLANTAITNDEYEKVPEILCEAMELKVLYPDREVFNSGEVLAFYETAFHYFIGIENAEEARIRLEIIQKLNEGFNLELNMFEFSRELMVLNLGNSITQDDEEVIDSYTVEHIPVKVVEETTEAPVFENELMHELYLNDLHIDPEIIQQILHLPSESLVSDLHKMLYDSIARYKVFTDDMEWSPKTHEFFIHAVSILADLKDDRSLGVIFDLLRQDEDYIETWLTDYLTEDFCEIVYHLGNDKLDKLRSFVFEPNRYLHSRTLISSVVQQIALHQPQRRTEVIEWYKSVIDEILEREEDESIIDSEWIAFIVSDLIDLQAIELTPGIIELYHHGLVFEGVTGNLSDCLKDIVEDSKIDRKRPVFDNIYDRYRYYLDNWHYYRDSDADKAENDDIPENKDAAKRTSYKEVIEKTPLPVEKPKAGRNDPCPCGSGKKYKKCCLNSVEH
jgi:tetratricopeptide (TPR) repeat protein